MPFHLWIGLPDGSGVAAIAGVRNPGVLTANQALVANATGYIDTIKVANAVVSYVAANGSLGSASQVLSSNSSGGVYWAAPVAGVNVAAQYTWSNTQTFQNTITFSSTINGTANNSLYLGGTAAADYQTNAGLSSNVATLTANAAGYLNGKTESNLNVNSALTANASTYLNGKTESNLNVNSASSAASANNASYLGGTAAASFQTTDGLSANVATLTANAATYLNGKTESNLNVNSASSATTANNSSYVGGNTASDLRTYSETTAGNAYTWAMANTLSRDGTYTGNNIFSGANNTFSGTNTRVTGFLTTANADLASVKVRTSSLISGSYDRNEVNLAAGDKLVISGGNYGMQLRAANNGTDWFTLDLNPDNGALIPGANNTMDLGTTTKRFGTLYLAGSTIYLGNTSMSDTAGGLTVSSANVTGSLNSSGNTNLGDSSSDVVSFTARVNTAIVPSANITYDLGTSDLRYNTVHTSNVNAEYISVGKDLAVSGNLYVTGTVAYINTTSFSTTDTMLQFASNNDVADILDIGFFGEYNESSTVKYTGLFRDATDGTYAIFTGLTAAPSGTVNTSHGSYNLASLKTYLNSSALLANSTQTNITANSSVSVAITANTLNFDTIDAGTF